MGFNSAFKAFNAAYRNTIELRLSESWLSESVWPLGKIIENFTKLTCLEITGYQIKYNAVSWLLELQIRRGGKV
jgi:hypothetical protein